MKDVESFDRSWSLDVVVWATGIIFTRNSKQGKTMRSTMMLVLVVFVAGVQSAAAQEAIAQESKLSEKQKSQLIIRFPKSDANKDGELDDTELLAGFAARYSDHWFAKCRISFDIAFFIAHQVRSSMISKRIIKTYITRAKAEAVDEILLGDASGKNQETNEKFFMLMGFNRIGGSYRYKE